MVLAIEILSQRCSLILNSGPTPGHRLFFLWRVVKYSCSLCVDVHHGVVGEGGCMLGQALLPWILLPVQSHGEIGGISVDSLRGPRVRNGAKHSNLD